MLVYQDIHSSYLGTLTPKSYSNHATKNKGPEKTGKCFAFFAGFFGAFIFDFTI